MNEEKGLHEIARRLGAQAAERLDLERTAEAVVERLREPVAPASRWIRVAAAFVILTGATLAARQLFNRPASTGHATAHYVTDDLTDLSTDQLREVLNTLDETLDLRGTTQPDSGLEDLDAQQLRTVLRSLEG